MFYLTSWVVSSSQNRTEKKVFIASPKTFKRRGEKVQRCS